MTFYLIIQTPTYVKKTLLQSIGTYDLVSKSNTLLLLSKEKGIVRYN